MLSSELFSEEEKNLFNPAICGFFLYSMVNEYCRSRNDGCMHISLVYLALPMIMDCEFQSSLPSNYRVPISQWVSLNEGVLVDFPLVARSYIPIVSAALDFLFFKGLLSIDSSGCLILGRNSLPKSPVYITSKNDLNLMFRAARLLGRWFARVPSVETIFIQFGVRP